jgi:hypothetical protein
MNDRHIIFTAAIMALGVVSLAAQETPSPTRLTYSRTPEGKSAAVSAGDR